MPRGSAKGDTKAGRNTASSPDQCTLQLQHLVFFSYSWPRLHVCWPLAISQGPVAKTVCVGWCGVRHGSRPAPNSALSPSHRPGTCACPHCEREVPWPKSLTLLSSCRADQSSLKQAFSSDNPEWAAVPSLQLNEHHEWGAAPPAAVSPQAVSHVLDT